MQSFTDLRAWKSGLQLVKEVYELTKKFPQEEIFGLTSQLRSASTSVLANLAEGFGKFTFADKAAKFVISRGECTETEALLFISVEVGFATQQDIQKITSTARTTGKMLSGLIASMKNRNPSRQ
jgi:four helix bundle protein